MLDGDAMKQFTLPLDKERQRPTLYLESFFRLSAMLDTGAVLPVWVEDEELLQSIGAIQSAENQPFGGFGGMTTASHSELSCQMILSATMFSGLIYEIDDFHHNFNVTIPDKESLVRKLVVEDNNGKLHVLCSGEEKKL